jgi:hypothetical protein
MGELLAGELAPILDLYIARAANAVRTGQDPIPIIAQGFDAVAHVSKTGDPTCKLERFLLEWADLRAPESMTTVEKLVEKPSKARGASYQMITTRAGIAARRNPEVARHIYATGIGRSDLDWPEAVYEAFIQFENLHGTVDTLIAAKEMIRKEQEKVTRRREKAAAEAAQQYQAYYGEAAAVAAAAPTTDTSAAAEPTPATAPAATPAPEVKRDREHTTVLVSGLGDITNERLESFFHDCGPVREITIIDAQGSKSALVEFRRADAIPAALARDRKKIDSAQVSVSMLWRSTLFITNFDKEFDDAKARELFGRVSAT